MLKLKKSSNTSMKVKFVDANIFIRFITKDDPEKARRCYELFAAAEKRKIVLTTNESILAEVVYILSSRSLYGLPTKKIKELLVPLVSLKGLQLERKKEFLLALEIYSIKAIDFEDALAASRMKFDGIETIYSYDRHFDKLAWVKRIEP